MTDKQINIVEILAEQCKNCILYEGDTISLNISMFDRPLKGICFNNNIHFSVDELNYIMQKLISKEQECEELKRQHQGDKGLITSTGKMNYQLLQEYDKLKTENDLAKQLINWILKFFELTDYDWQDDQNEISALIEDYIDDKNSTIDFVNDINKGLFKKLTEIKEIAEKNLNIHTCAFKGCGYDLITKQILQKIGEVEE